MSRGNVDLLGENKTDISFLPFYTSIQDKLDCTVGSVKRETR